MRIIDTLRVAGREVTDFGSRSFTVFPTARDARVVLAKLDAGGVIGTHPTVLDQLFLILKGEARVSGKDGQVQRIGPGAAALWVAGEKHSTEALSDLQAVVIEAEGLASRFHSDGH